MATIAGFVINWLSGFIVWIFFIWVGVWIYRKIKKSVAPFPSKKAAIFAIALSLLPAISISFRDAKRPQVMSLNFSAQDKSRVNDILMEVLRSEGPISPELKAEFHSIVQRYRVPASTMRAEMELMIGPMTTYYKEFWEDARLAVKEGRAFKSLERSSIEEKFLSSGAIHKWRIEENDRTIEKIANKQPIGIQGQQVILSEDDIVETLNNVDDQINRLQDLYQGYTP